MNYELSDLVNYWEMKEPWNENGTLFLNSLFLKTLQSQEMVLSCDQVFESEKQWNNVIEWGLYCPCGPPW